MQHAAVNRRFAIIFVMSLLLHGLLFALIARQRPAPRPLPLLVATLRLNPPAPSGASAAPAAALPEKVRLPPARRENLSSPRVMAAAGPTKSAPAKPASPAAPVAPPIVPAPAPMPEERPARPASANLPAETPAARPAPDVLAAYRQHLSELFARQQAYPRIAALRGWEGEVRLRLKVARKGHLLGVVLDRSSGFDVLDQHALAMLTGFGTLPPLPEALESNEIQVIVPINYKLNKTT